MTGEVEMTKVYKMGWAHPKPKGSREQDSPRKWKRYVSRRFLTGERTGRKADPPQVAAEMREAREADGTTKFIRNEGLTKNQVQSFFSRLSALKRRKATVPKDSEQDANDDDDHDDDDNKSLIEEESG